MQGQPGRGLTSRMGPGWPESRSYPVRECLVVTLNEERGTGCTLSETWMPWKRAPRKNDESGVPCAGCTEKGRIYKYEYGTSPRGPPYVR
jgi:hypothetical protein